MPRKIKQVISDSGDLVALTEDGTLWRLVELDEQDPDTNEPIEAWEMMPEIPTDDEIAAASAPVHVEPEGSEQHAIEPAPPEAAQAP